MSIPQSTKTIREILDELLEYASFGGTYKEDTIEKDIDKALADIKAKVLKRVPNKVNMKKVMRVEYHKGYNQAIEETKKNIKEICK